MRLFVLVIPLALAVGIPSAALAAEPAPPPPIGDSPAAPTPDSRSSAFELGARVGYALPFGSIAPGVSLDSVADGAVPVWIDVGWRTDRSWFVGAYGSLAGVLTSGSFCPNVASCSGTDARLGLQVHYSFHPAPGVSPWVGLGAGYEWLHVGATEGSASSGISVRGFELLNLQGGVDFRASEGVRLGPFAAFSLGEYESVSATGVTRDGASYSASASIEHQAVHEWLTLGVRGRFDL